MKRRTLLSGGAAMAALGGLGGLLRARASGSGACKNLVVVLNFGGWDTTYTIDPKPGLERIDAPEGDVRMFGGLPIYDSETRPQVTEFFQTWGSECAVVNGVQVRSFVHSDCVKRILTGGPSEVTPDLAAISAYELGRERPVPYLAFGSQARSGPFASLTGRTGTLNQLTTLANPERAYPRPGAFGPDQGFQPTAAESELLRAYLEGQATALETRFGTRGYNGDRIDDYRGSLTRADLLRQFSLDNDLGELDYTPDLAVQVPMAINAMRDGLAQTIMMETGGWDTHTYNAMQGELHNNLFGALNELVQGLNEENLLRDTMVVVLSEMGRTPLLNADMGKDHWPVTSAMLLGGDVRGGRALGGTNDELGALSMDLQTGDVREDGKQLQTSNLVAGILESVGVDPEPYFPGVEAFRAFL